MRHFIDGVVINDHDICFNDYTKYADTNTSDYHFALSGMIGGRLYKRIWRWLWFIPNG